ncbi:MAG TPA: GNAT family N-acetyltransferase [Candidatus Ozemobacteraceae bacterium]|nr:GNAT family N-acetyltransferase [Candidatus Ozemobacteraceae bacterium]
MKWIVTDAAITWESALQALPHDMRDIYFSYRWHALFAADSPALPRLFLCEREKGRLLYPFLLHPVPATLSAQPAYACESAYGYGGPLAWDLDPDATAEAERLFCTWARANNVVAEFIRFHPLLDNHGIFSANLEIETNRETVPVPLDAPFETLCGRFSAAKRRNIRKAAKAGLTVSTGTDFPAFWRLYEMTMTRRHAPAFYHFPAGHRVLLEQIVRDTGFLLEARIGGRIVAAALFLVAAGTLHYHLGGSDPDALSLAPNDALMAEAVRKGRELGLSRLHLGGGATTAPDDSLLRFKSGFSPSRAAFRVGKRVHDPERHAQLRRLRQERCGHGSPLFLSYLETP